METCKLSEGVEVVPYGGKDSLKNTILLKFILDKFDKVFITFDLDAKNELEKHLKRIGLEEHKDYCAIGIDEPGKDCIEGLVPQQIVAKVHSENTDLMMKFASQDNKIRLAARDDLKKKILQEFKGKRDFQKEELKSFENVIKSINQVLK